MTSAPPDNADELALTERVAGELTRLGLTSHVGHLREYWAALKAGRPSKVWSRELSIEWLRILRLPPHESDYPVLPRMADCPGCAISQKFTSAVFPGGAKFKCGACKTQWLELDVCRWTLNRKVTRIDSAERDAICIDCGARSVRRPTEDDSLDDYELTVDMFAARAPTLGARHSRCE